MRALAVYALLGLMGCAPDPRNGIVIPNPADAAAALDDSGSGNADDAAQADAGARDAFVPDSGTTRDSSVAPDAGGDVGSDSGTIASEAGTDAAVADAGPSDAGRCTVVPQSGCVDREACRFQSAGGVRTGTACEPAGTDRDGWPCERYDGGGDSCMPGLWCLTRCVRSCRADADCPPLDGRARECDPGGTAGPFCVFQ